MVQIHSPSVIRITVSSEYIYVWVLMLAIGKHRISSVPAFRRIIAGLPLRSLNLFSILPYRNSNGKSAVFIVPTLNLSSSCLLTVKQNVSATTKFLVSTKFAFGTT